MRMRHKPWALPELKEDPICFLEPFEMKGTWQEHFGNEAPIELEIGCGKGDFIVARAQQDPATNFVAMDLKNEVLIYALRKANELGLSNLRILSMKADDLDRVFAPGEISRIYINFANPWPKAGHNKRRLTHPRFLAIYRLFTAVDSVIEFKTDDEELYTASLDYFPVAGYEILYQTMDLPKDHPGNIETEYETKFRSFGMPIYRIDARQRPITDEALSELLDYRRKAQARTGRSGWTRYQSFDPGPDSGQDPQT